MHLRNYTRWQLVQTRRVPEALGITAQQHYWTHNGGSPYEGHARQRQSAQARVHRSRTRGGRGRARAAEHRRRDILDWGQARRRMHGMRTVPPDGRLHLRRRRQRIPRARRRCRRLRLWRTGALRTRERIAFELHGSALLLQRARRRPGCPALQARRGGRLRTARRNHRIARRHPEVLHHLADAHCELTLLEHGARQHRRGGRAGSRGTVDYAAARPQHGLDPAISRGRARRWYRASRAGEPKADELHPLAARQGGRAHHDGSRVAEGGDGVAEGAAASRWRATPARRPPPRRCGYPLRKTPPVPRSRARRRGRRRSPRRNA